MNIAIEIFTTYCLLRVVFNSHLVQSVIGKEASMKSSKLYILKVNVINNFVMFLKRSRDVH